ncbi:MAG TPA: thioredoxin family protein [Burkholderiales bacterium]
MTKVKAVAPVLPLRWRGSGTVEPSVELQLFVSPSFAPCLQAERVWREIAAEAGVELAVIDIESEHGRAVASELGLAMVPAIAVDGRLVAIGVQTHDEARSVLADAVSGVRR